MRFLDVAGSGNGEFPRKNGDLDTSGRGWTGYIRIRNQQVSGSSPLAGSIKINNLRRSRVQTDPTRVTTVSPPIRRWIGLATTPRREGRPTQVDSPRTRPEASRHHRRKGAEPTGEVPQSEGVRHEPAAGRGGPARQDAVVSDGHARSDAALAGPHAGSLLPIRRTGRRLHCERMFAIHRPHSLFRVSEALPGNCRSRRSTRGSIPVRAEPSACTNTHRCRRSVHPRCCRALPSFRGASQRRLRFIPRFGGALGRPRTAHPTGDQGRHNRLIDPVAEPGQAAEASPRRSTRPTAEPNDAPCGGACSNVLRDDHELVD